MDQSAITAPRRSTTADQAYEAILEAILSGRLRPEEPLRLTALADSLAMSMMPVREAVRRLESLGVIEVEPYRGARVSRVSPADLVDTYRIRILLEGLMCRMAASKFTRDLYDRAVGHLDRQAECQRAGDREGARAAHRDYHFTIYHAAEAPWAVRSLEPTWANSERYRIGSNITTEVVEMRRVEHIAIIDACLAGDPVAAEAALRDHLLRTVTAVDADAAAELAAEFGLPVPEVATAPASEGRKA